jgi:site-specific DNA recombinase
VRVAIYTRISTDEDLNPHSLSAQAERCEAFVKLQEDWTVVRNYSDQLSAKDMKRPGLQRALREADAQVYDVLLVYAFDRLTRTVGDLSPISDRLMAAGVSLRSVTQPLDPTDPAGRLHLNTLISFAEFERESIRARMMGGRERRAERGEWIGGYVPFGYHFERGWKDLQVDPVQAPIVREIFDRYVNRLQGSASIARWLEGTGHRTRPGNLFSPQTVLSILRNRVYVGEFLYAKKYHQGSHPALIEMEVFEAAQRILGDRGRNASLRRSNQSDYLLTGLVRCASCGGGFVGKSGNGRGGRYGYYWCNTRNKYKKCDAETIPAEELEEAILDQLCRLLAQEDVIRRAIEAASEDLDAAAPAREEQAASVNAELKQIKKNLSKYFEAFESDQLDATLLRGRLQSLRERQQALEARQAELEAEALQRPEPLTEDQLHDLRMQIGDVLRHGDRPQQKAVLQAFVDRIEVVSRDEIQPYYCLPAGVRPPFTFMGAGGFEPPKAEPTGLQPVPFGRSGTPPGERHSSPRHRQKRLTGVLPSHR